MESAVKRKLSWADCLHLEEEENTRYEYHDGEVFAIAGGSPKYGAIAANVIGLFSNFLTEGCRTFNSDVKVCIQSINKGLYPDVSVACRPIELMREVNAIINPILLVEVLSQSTSDYDRAAKFRHYSQLASFREYVLIEQEARTVETRYRSSVDAPWKMDWFEADRRPGEDTEVILQSLNITLPMREIYKGVDDL